MSSELVDIAAYTCVSVIFLGLVFIYTVMVLLLTGSYPTVAFFLFVQFETRIRKELLNIQLMQTNYYISKHSQAHVNSEYISYVGEGGL